MAQLHRHALESVFAFASLDDLAHVSLVSRNWLAAVVSMRATAAAGWYSCFGARSGVFASPLARHLHSLLPLSRGDSLIGVEQILSLNVHAPSLASFTCELVDGFQSAHKQRMLSRPLLPQLTELTLRLNADVSAADCASVVEVVASLPQLATLRLTLANLQWLDADFSPFRRTLSLRSLILGVSDLRRPILWTEQLSDLRSLSQLETLEWPVSDSDEFWRMFAEGHQLRLQSLSITQRMCPRGVDDQGAALLLHMPSLTQLQFSAGALSSLSFLSSLPHLATVSLTFNSLDLGQAPSLKGLVPLAAIHQLFLKNATGIGGADVDILAYFTQLLECAPQLRSLMLINFTLASLPPLPRSLVELSLYQCDVPFASAAKSVWPLQQLESLSLALNTALTADERASMTVPCARLPNLREFHG